MSLPPFPARLLEKYRLSPDGEIVGAVSFAMVLMTLPIFCGELRVRKLLVGAVGVCETPASGSIVMATIKIIFRGFIKITPCW
jgi:hypothetical protein